ncbi:MAG: 16S rRNA (cytosine(1402)-N(4))-methyltransferase RsmH [Kiritimatiellae bacterium]|nr:16S rRNA (cytosine(1402)-N(4))-methyltransferase RsmH [Kiritimatiellia bacterium]
MHIPVLFEETVDALAVKAGGTYVDGTLGRAGHASEVLRRAGPEGRLLGIDRDGEALARAAKVLDPIPGHKVLAHGEHGDLAAIATANGFDAVDGILLDLGVSSDQLDTPERGFSFRADGPLDMRMDQTRGKPAAELVNGLSEEELARLFRELGEEPRAKAAARAICRERERSRIVTTGRLAEIVGRAVGGSGGKRNPATRVFQALRMSVNRELENLVAALDGGLKLLKSGGRMAVITFESLTDRVVKQCFAAHAGCMVSLQQGGQRWEGELPAVVKVTRHPVVAGDAELERNPRARSAKLRVVERSDRPPGED